MEFIEKTSTKSFLMWQMIDVGPTRNDDVKQMPEPNKEEKRRPIDSTIFYSQKMEISQGNKAEFI